jgi:hypothetical protein
MSLQAQAKVETQTSRRRRDEHGRGEAPDQAQACDKEETDRMERSIRWRGPWLGYRQ